MSQIAELKDLFLAQKELDLTIAKNHNITYQTTRNKRIMALLVEIGELANTTRCFKFWSNKGMEEKDVVLDEFADGLHFFLSLGLDIHTSLDVYEVVNPHRELTEQFLKVYNNINDFYNNPIDSSFINAFSSFLSLLPLLGYTWEDLKQAYYKKLDTNFVRQQTNY